MAAKKGQISAHIKKKEFSHPNTQYPINLNFGLFPNKTQNSGD